MAMRSMSGVRMQATATDTLSEAQALVASIGDEVRTLKGAEDKDKDAIDAAVARLLAAKAELAALEEAEAASKPFEPTMDDVINVCKRRGFIFQSSEVCAHRDPPAAATTTATCLQSMGPAAGHRRTPAALWPRGQAVVASTP